jgi:hypothetical protein
MCLRCYDGNMALLPLKHAEMIEVGLQINVTRYIGKCGILRTDETNS